MATEVDAIQQTLDDLNRDLQFMLNLKEMNRCDILELDFILSEIRTNQESLNYINMYHGDIPF